MQPPTMANGNDFDIPDTIAALESFDMNTNAERIAPANQLTTKPNKIHANTCRSSQLSMLKRIADRQTNSDCDGMQHGDRES